MNANIWLLPLSLSLVLSLAACSGSKSSGPVKTAEISSEDIIESKSLSPAEKAEKLALAAEQLMSPLSFMYADEVAQQALSIDKKNQRALYVRAMVRPMMTLRGIMKRIEPIATRNAESKAEYQKALAKLEEAPKHALKDFLLDGKPTIRTESDAQTAIDSLRAGLTYQRAFFKSAKNSEMVLNLPEAFVVGASNDEETTCYWTQSANGYYQQYCDTKKKPVILQYKANRADFEALQQLVAGFEIYMVFLNSYSLSGAVKVSDKYKDVDASSAQIRAELLSDKDFGRIRGKSLASILSMGLDAVSGARYAKAMKKEWCPSGVEVEGARPGYLFSKGVCVQENSSKSATLDEILATVELVFKGGLYSQVFSGSNGSHATEIRPASFFEGKVADVRDLGLTFNKCNRVTSASDSSLGGIFVNKDVNAVFALSDNSCD